MRPGGAEEVGDARVEDLLGDHLLLEELADQPDVAHRARLDALRENLLGRLFGRGLFGLGSRCRGRGRCRARETRQKVLSGAYVNAFVRLNGGDASFEAAVLNAFASTSAMVYLQQHVKRRRLE